MSGWRLGLEGMTAFDQIRLGPAPASSRLRSLMFSRTHSPTKACLGSTSATATTSSRFNPRRLFPLVDDKLKTKRLALQAGIAVPQLYGVIETQHDIRSLPDIVRDHPEFALKPAHGSAGDGIIVISGRSGSRYRTIGGALLDADYIAHHLSNAINGQFSLGGVPDVVIVEYMVRFSPLFERISYQGVPDIRVIVFRGYPIMAMVRLPTRTSQGKANLHQGAVGAGIDLATGVTFDGVIGTEVVTHHPDTMHADRGAADSRLGHDSRHLGAMLRAHGPGLHRRRHRARPRSRSAGTGVECAPGPRDPDRESTGIVAPSAASAKIAPTSARRPRQRIEFAKREFRHPVGAPA